MQEISNQKTKVGILGLGNIGMRYDINLSSNHVLTHCRAVENHPECEILFGIDINESAKRDFQEHYHKKAYSTIHQAVQSCGEPDVWICALHPHDRIELLDFCQKHPPRGLFIEKPFGPENSEFDVWQRLHRQFGSFIMVNFPRYFDSTHQKTSERLKIEQTLYAKCLYPKDWLTNGIHFVLQSLVFWGYPENIVIHPRVQKKVNRWLGEVSFEYPQFRVDFIGIDSDLYNVAEFEILTDCGRHLILDSGRSYRFDPIEYNSIWNMNFIAFQSEICSTDLINYQRESWNFFINNFHKPLEIRQEISGLNLSKTHQAQKICEEVLEQWSKL
jgi:hypothetical protein